MKPPVNRPESNFSDFAIVETVIDMNEGGVELKILDNSKVNAVFRPVRLALLLIPGEHELSYPQ